MKKLFIIILAIHLLSGNIVFSEVTKLAFLMEHFFQHRQTANISFTEFLWLHYDAHSKHQQETHNDHHHESLPLKVLTVSLFLCSDCRHYPPSVCRTFAIDTTLKTNKLRPTSPLFSDSKIRFSVFQPPRA